MIMIFILSMDLFGCIKIGYTAAYHWLLIYGSGGFGSLKPIFMIKPMFLIIRTFSCTLELYKSINRIKDQPLDVRNFG